STSFWSGSQLMVHCFFAITNFCIGRDNLNVMTQQPEFDQNDSDSEKTGGKRAATPNTNSSFLA
ncbi:MAG: hypothetical protein KJZ95_19215, partial [Caldilinea sp.]|nr:hypothetical protein [Caldilinea sp.]